MKKITTLVAFLLLSIISTNAQNGGQFRENDAVKIVYNGYSESNHEFYVINKQFCTVVLRVNVDNKTRDSLVSTNAGDTITMRVYKQSQFEHTKFSVKATKACITTTDMGWVEMILPFPASVALYERDPEYIREREGMKVSIVGHVLYVTTGDYKRYDLLIESFSVDGKRVFQTKSQFQKTTVVDLNSSKSCAYTRVVLQNRFPHNFVFKRHL